MNSLVLPKLAIVCGGGNAPLHVIETCVAQGRPFFVVCLEGNADPQFASQWPHIWLHFGAATLFRDVMRDQEVKEVVFIGYVRRPSLFEIRPDWLAVKIMARLGINMLGDDGLLRALGHAIEQECGVHMIGIQDILGGVLIHAGPLGQLRPDDQAQLDIVRGVDVARALGHVDVGQAVVIQQGLVLGVEAIEGTDALLRRSKELARGGPGGVLVKLAKAQQDTRYDLPTIGPNTVVAARDAGIRGIAVEAEKTLLIDREKLKQAADEAGLFIVGI